MGQDHAASLSARAKDHFPLHNQVLDQRLMKPKLMIHEFMILLPP